jgi:hypothetical protein
MNEHVKNICKIGQGADCCKYLVAGTKGFECMKFNPENKAMIDINWTEHNHIAQGDNCDGVADLSFDLIFQW